PPASTSAELVESEVLMLVHTAPLSHCHTASVAPFAAFDVIAIPASPFAEEPPGTWSAASLKAAPNSATTVAPGGLPVSSATAARLTVAVARVGASFTAPTVMLALAVVAENAVVPPLVLVSASAPLV